MACGSINQLVIERHQHRCYVVWNLYMFNLNVRKTVFLLPTQMHVNTTYIVIVLLPQNVSVLFHHLQEGHHSFHCNHFVYHVAFEFLR